MNILERFQQGELLGKSGANVIPPSAETSGATNSPATATSMAPATPSTKNDITRPNPPSDPSKYRIMLCGTYPIGQSNGYSRVVYYLAKYLGIKQDIQLTIYGFQNFKQTQGSEIRTDIPDTVILHDALATENPKRNGFGEKEVATYLRSHPQDMVIIFNDMVITAALTKTIVEELSPVERSQFLLVSYMDQVYPYQKKPYIDMLNLYFHAVIAFTPYWRTIARKLGLKKDIPCFVLPHGFDKKLYYPIPRNVARVFYNIADDAFVVLNLNRNQPRKRWDHTMMAFAEVVSRYYQKVQAKEPVRPLRMMIATMVQGFWDLMEVYENELRLRDVPVEFGKQCIIALARPQQMSDRDINILYSACDVGLNTCEGEGFGLCQIEHAAVGCPQIAPRIGGLQEFLHDDYATLIEPKWRYYIDKQRDGIGGIAEVGDPMDYANAIWKYYTQPELVKEHGTKARKAILENYPWDVIVDHFHRVILNMKQHYTKKTT